MAPATDNIDHYQGDTFSRAYECYTDAARTIPRNLTGYTPKAQLRQAAAPTGSLLATFTTAISGAANNIITLTLPAATTATITDTSAWFDVQITSPTGVVETLVRGKITFTQEVTT